MDLLLGRLTDLGIKVSIERVTEELLNSGFNMLSKVFDYLAKDLVGSNDRLLNQVRKSKE